MTIPNFCERTGRAYGVHGPNGCETVQTIIQEVIEIGTDVTYDEAVKDLKEKVKNWLDDPSGIEEATGLSDYSPHDDSITDGLFKDFVADALKAADVISSTDWREDGSDAGLIDQVADAYDAESGFDWDEVFDAVLQHVNDAGWLDDGEPHTYVHTYVLKDDDPDQQVSVMVTPLGGALHLWVCDSPYVTPCGGCSPCIPGAGDLDTPIPFFDPDFERRGYDPAHGKFAHCLPPEWFTENVERVPYIGGVYHHTRCFDADSKQHYMVAYTPGADGITKTFFGAHED